MQRLTEEILEHSRTVPEGALLTAKGLLHLGQRAAVDQALSRLARRGKLLRAGRGLYVRPVESRFGARAPTTEKVVAGLAELRGETVASHGAAAANALGLTSQVPVRSVYLTSGPSRTLRLGRQSVEMRHAPAWQLVLAGRPAGEILRALAWLGPSKAEGAMLTLRRTLPASDLQALAKAAPLLPTWLAQQVSQSFAHV
jgi:hypothetical protein